MSTSYLLTKAILCDLKNNLYTGHHGRTLVNMMTMGRCVPFAGMAKCDVVLYLRLATLLYSTRHVPKAGKINVINVIEESV